MTYANVSERQAFISGLRRLADFLETNPQVPVPASVDVLVFPPRSTDVEMCSEIDAIASLIGSHSRTACKHYVTSRSFGPIEYRAVVIPSAELKE